MKIDRLFVIVREAFLSIRFVACLASSASSRVLPVTRFLHGIKTSQCSSFLGPASEMPDVIVPYAVTAFSPALHNLKPSMVPPMSFPFLTRPISRTRIESRRLAYQFSNSGLSSSALTVSSSLLESPSALIPARDVTVTVVPLMCSKSLPAVR